MASNVRTLSGKMFLLVVLIDLTSLSGSVSAVSEGELASMLTVLRARGYGLFANAITASDAYYDVLAGDSFTFFAPTDSTLFALDMTAAAPEYISTLRYHIVPRRLSVRDFQRIGVAGANLSTLMEDHEVFVQIRPFSEMITVEGVDVVIPGLFYSRNLAVHGLGGILRFRSQIRPYFGVSPPFPPSEASNSLPPPFPPSEASISLPPPSQVSPPPELGGQTADSGNSKTLPPSQALDKIHPSSGVSPSLPQPEASNSLPPDTDSHDNQVSPPPEIVDETADFGDYITIPPSQALNNLHPPADLIGNRGSPSPAIGDSITPPPSEAPFYLHQPTDLYGNGVSLPPETSNDRDLQFGNSPAPSIVPPPLISPDYRSIEPPTESTEPESATTIDQSPPVGSPLQISPSIGLPPSISVASPPVGSLPPAPPPSIGGVPVINGGDPVPFPAFPEIIEDPSKTQPWIEGFFPVSNGGDPIPIPEFPEIVEDSSNGQRWKRQLRETAATAAASGIAAAETPMTWQADNRDVVDCPVSVTPLGHVSFQQYASSGPTCARLKASL